MASLSKRSDPGRPSPLATSAWGGTGILGLLLDFGDKQKKDESQPLIECPRCKNKTVYTAKRQRWVEILTIAVFPKGDKITLLLCSECPWGMEKGNYDKAIRKLAAAKKAPKEFSEQFSY